MAFDAGGLSYIGGGISDIFNSFGQAGDAKSLDQAAGMEDTNAKIATASMEIQQTAATRDIYKVQGAQEADVAKAGFQVSGTAQDLARSTAQQGSLTHSLIQAQGEVDIQSHEIAAAGLRSQAQAARNASTGSMIGGVLGIATGVLSMFGGL